MRKKKKKMSNSSVCLQHVSLRGDSTVCCVQIRCRSDVDLGRSYGTVATGKLAKAAAWVSSSKEKVVFVWAQCLTTILHDCLYYMWPHCVCCCFRDHCFPDACVPRLTCVLVQLIPVKSCVALVTLEVEVDAASLILFFIFKSYRFLFCCWKSFDCERICLNSLFTLLSLEPSCSQHTGIYTTFFFSSFILKWECALGNGAQLTCTSQQVCIVLLKTLDGRWHSEEEDDLHGLAICSIVLKKKNIIWSVVTCLYSLTLNTWFDHITLHITCLKSDVKLRTGM